MLAKRCWFKETSYLLPIDFAIYKLDVDALRHSEPILYERVRHAVGPDNTLGYVMPPSDDLLGNAIMNQERRVYASQSFDEIWNLKVSRAV
jgi:hypothetical protein